MITNTQISNIIILIQSLRTDWALQAIRPVIEELANAGLDVLTITNAAVRAASDQQWRKPTAILYLAQEDPEARHDHIRPESQVVCETCGKSERACRRAQENQIRLGNDVHDRHRGREWGDDPRHEFESHIEGETGEIPDHGSTIMNIRSMLALNRRTVIDREPWMPVDQLREGDYPPNTEDNVDQAFPRATGDDQEAQQGSR